MRTSRNRRTLQLVVLGVVALLAVIAWVSASAQSEPPFRLYGTGEAGDTIDVYDEAGHLLGTTTVESNNTWHVDVECDAEQLRQIRFTLNGEAADATIDQTGRDQASVALSASESGMMSPTGEDEMMQEDSMVEESEMESEMMAGDTESDEMMEDAGYPDSGSGGLAAGGPSTSALIGTILVLAALALGVGVWRVRRRA